jgi:hypothetical protein
MRVAGARCARLQFPVSETQKHDAATMGDDRRSSPLFHDICMAETHHGHQMQTKLSTFAQNIDSDWNWRCLERE